MLYKLDVETNQVEKLLHLEVQKEESKMSGFAIAMIIMAIAFFFAFIGFAAEAVGLGVFGLIAGFISLNIQKPLLHKKLRAAQLRLFDIKCKKGFLAFQETLNGGSKNIKISTSYFKCRP